jgi:hypothetical protein
MAERFDKGSSQPETGNAHLELLTEPYVSLSTHTALVIQPSTSKFANEQTTLVVANTATLAKNLSKFSCAANFCTYVLPTS